jgi:adenylate cyclase
MERKLAAILSADVAGYSRLMEEDEVGTIHTLNARRAVTDSCIHQHRGRIVGTAGDSILAEFASAVDAVQCAIEIQQELKARNADLPPERRMEFRIGINVGDVVVEGEQLYGDGVNVAARLQTLADVGGVFISGTVYDQVKTKLTLGYEWLGEQTVKNIVEPVRVWRVRLDEAGASGEAGSPKFEVQGPKSKVQGPKPRRVGTVYLPRAAALAATGILLLVGIIVAVQYLSLRPPVPSANIPPEQAQPLPLPNKPSIAVLPFTNRSGDPEQESFSDGITEDLITDLSKLSSLVVISHYSTFIYKGKAVKVQEVSKELGVRYVLEGSVRKAGDRMLINAQLIDGNTGGNVWAERYERPLQDLFAVQEEVRRKIVVHLALKLTDEERVRLERAYTPHPEAYDSTLRGLGYIYRFTPEANAQARQLCERAIALDPTYGVAYSVLGWTYLTEWVLQWSQDRQTLERAFTLAQQAIALDDSLPPAHELLGMTYLWKDGQHEQALAEVKRALAHGPSWFSAYNVLGLALNFAGRPEETIANAEQALRLSPRSLLYLPILAQAYALTGRYEEAIAAYQKILLLIPHYPNAHLGLAGIYSELGREEEARAEAAEVLRINPNFSLEAVKQRAPFKDPAVLERQLAAWRRGGLK